MLGPLPNSHQLFISTVLAPIKWQYQVKFEASYTLIMFENMKSETLLERGSIEILNTNQPLNNINNVWQLPFTSGKTATPKSLESQNVQSHAVRRIIQTPSPESFPGVSQDPLQAVIASPTLQRKSTPENSPNTSQNPVHANTTIPTVQHSPVASLDYSDPKRVPRTDQNIYRHATIKPEFRERYPQLVDFFKWAVDTDKELRKHTSKINYELLLCGSTPANAVASVVIFCAKAIFNDLRSLLGSKHIRLQYQLKNPSFWDKFQLAPSKTHPQVSATIVVPFNVVYWRVVNSPTLRNSAMEQVVARNHSSLTMCGSLIKYGDRTSTLGLLISMDFKLYGLTVDHLFKDQQGEEQPMTANEAEVLYDEDDYDDSEPEWSWIDDVNYEDFDNAECVSDAESVSSGGSHAKITMDREPNEDFGESINGHKADSMFKTDATTAYLDWALIEFDDGYYERPNAFFSEDDPTNPKFFGILAAAPKTSDVKVFMISGVSGTRKGVMLNRSSYIGGKPGEDLCQAWNVILSDCSCVIDGDCGSLIVDQETLEVYGHVVASNPLGEAYVVPLQNTFHQISSAFGAQDLSLPNPVLLMDSIVAHYSQKDNSGVADKAKQILASINDPVSVSSPGSLGGLNLCLLSKFAVTLGAQTGIEQMSLQNSTKSKLRMSFSQDPLFVRSGPFQPAEEVVPIHANRNGGHRKSNVTSWSEWEWSEDRKQWQSYRTNSRGETDWKFEGDLPTSTSSIAANIARSDDTLQLNTVSENKTQCSVDQNYTRDNKNEKALTDSLTTTDCEPVANLEYNNNFTAALDNPPVMIQYQLERWIYDTEYDVTTPADRMEGYNYKL
ncbi:uncharacterized protein EAE97_006564 [Botrytis byssoidea]|uniref:Uncharacterized protein n=1 Tax=Botrytis byssoidea TaxID=139641 RepID=A0A9P5ILT3_9HELO|nr:uncharacterized protein EAE97_006564 [Botrytis byssoidea]KAF7941727.1 hypothetical protein EAE97_006564 [Botrytis byssoidea]